MLPLTDTSSLTIDCMAFMPELMLCATIVLLLILRLFGGNRKEAEAHLRASLQYNPNSTVSHFFLAELLIDADRTDEARAELRRVLDAPYDPEWAPEDSEYKEKARKLLESLKQEV